jgi:hypothetical protein
VPFYSGPRENRLYLPQGLGGSCVRDGMTLQRMLRLTQVCETDIVDVACGIRSELLEGRNRES